MKAREFQSLQVHDQVAGGFPRLIRVERVSEQVANDGRPEKEKKVLFNHIEVMVEG